MCNLYSLTKGQAAIREIARAMKDSTGNLSSMPGIFPDYPAPVIAKPMCRAVHLFSEFNKAEGGDVWFALDDDRPLAVFAGIWTNWKSV